MRRNKTSNSISSLRLCASAVEKSSPRPPRLRVETTFREAVVFLLLADGLEKGLRNQ